MPKRKINFSAVKIEKIDPMTLIKDKHIEKFGYTGSVIRAHRIMRGIQMKHLSEMLRIRSSTLNRYECGEKKLGIKLAKQLAEIFKIDWRNLRKSKDN